MICGKVSGKHVIVRRATAGDAAEICEVVRSSITDLCVADHRNDAELLGRWLQNKTPENVTRWIGNPHNFNLLAEYDGHISAAGCVTTSGEIILNYVHPRARFQGISSCLLSALEEVIKGRGIMLCRLESTTTARRFYRDRQFVDDAPPSSKFGLTAWPMTKLL